jgi:hypothetical protein
VQRTKPHFFIIGQKANEHAKVIVLSAGANYSKKEVR